MTEGLHNVGAIIRAFNEIFRDAGFQAPVRVFERRRPWRCYADSKRIDLAFGIHDQNEYVEFSAWSKFSGNWRGRIFEDGSHEPLEGEQEMIVFDPSVPADAEMAEARMANRNERVSREQMAAGFPAQPDHSLLRDALARTAHGLAGEWPEMLSGPRREHRFRSVLRRALEFEVGDLVAQEKRVVLGEDWPNVPPKFLGGVDLLVGYMPGDDRWRYLAELKWSAEGQAKLYECLWDAFKMLAGSRIHYVESAYVVAAASKSEWSRPCHCSEIFADGEWDVSELLTRYESDWAYLVQESGSPPRRLPRRFRTTLVTEEQLEDFTIRAVAISSGALPDVYVDFEAGRLV